MLIKRFGGSCRFVKNSSAARIGLQAMLSHCQGGKESHVKQESRVSCRIWFKARLQLLPARYTVVSEADEAGK